MASFRSNVVANYLGRATSMASVYVFVLFYVSLLGVEAFGIISFYTILLSFASLFDVGISATFSRQAAFQTDRAELLDIFTTFGRVLLISQVVVAGAVMVLALPITRHWLKLGDAVDADMAVTSVRLMTVVLVPQLMMSFYTGGLMGLQRQVQANVIQACFSLSRSGLVILPLLIWPDLRVFFLWQAAVALIFALLSRRFLLSAMGHGMAHSGRFVFEKIKPLMGYSAGMLAMTVIATINTQLDKLVVSSHFAIASFSYYSLASSLAQIPLALSQPVAMALFPRLTTYVAAGDSTRLSADYQRQSAIITLLGGLAAFGIVAFTPELLQVWFPGHAMPDFMVPVTRILALGGLFRSLQLGPYYLSLAHGENRFIAVLAGLALLISVPLTFILIGHYGLFGAAIPWLLVNGINFIALSTSSHRRFHRGRTGQWLWGAVLGPLSLGAAAMALARAAANGLGLGAIASLALAGVAGALALAASYINLTRSGSERT